MDKKEIRADLLSKRDTMSQETWVEYSRKIERNLLRSHLFKECDKLFLYADFHGEVGTITLIEEALMRGKKIYLPKVHENFDENKMDFYNITSTFELVSGYKGIMEPISSQDRRFNYEEAKNEKLLMLVPGIAFDINGNRLGYGKGYYDNYLKDKPSMTTIGLCFSMQIMDDIPVIDTDIKLDYIISEQTTSDEINTYKFKNL